LSAPAGDDVRIAGGDVTVTAPVNGDLVLAGGDVTVGYSHTSNSLSEVPAV
jgi:hypothetical protein